MTRYGSSGIKRKTHLAEPRLGPCGIQNESADSAVGNNEANPPRRKTRARQQHRDLPSTKESLKRGFYAGSGISGAFRSLEGRFQPLGRGSDEI